MRVKIKTMLRWLQVTLLTAMPLAVEAHSGHGSASFMQHDAQHIMWLLAAVAAMTLTVAMLMKKSSDK